MTINKNQRIEERVNVTLPVKLDNAVGLTRDVSASGICFEIDATYTLGSEISFVIEMNSFNEKMLFKCKGSIIRTESHGQKIGVAVKVIESVIESAS